MSSCYDNRLDCPYIHKLVDICATSQVEGTECISVVKFYVVVAIDGNVVDDDDDVFCNDEEEENCNDHVISGGNGSSFVSFHLLFIVTKGLCNGKTVCIGYTAFLY